MNEGDRVRFPPAGKLFAPGSGYEEALKRNTVSGPRARINHDAHPDSIISDIDPGRSTELSRHDSTVDVHIGQYDDYRHDDDYDDAHLTPVDQLDPTFRSRLSRARKAPNTISETTDSCRSI